MQVTGQAQHDAWQRKVMPPAEQLASDLWSIPVTIPNNPLRYVNCYAFGTGAGLVLLDTGWASEESWQALTAGLAVAGAAVTDIRGVLISHLHLDHSGLAGRIRQESGAWVAMHPAEHAAIARPDYRDAALAVRKEAEFLRALGATAAEAEDVVETEEEFAPFCSVALPDRELADGDLADVPGWRLRAVHTPGHTPGHLCFADERARRLFAGDHILPRITPNVSVQRADPVDPLHDYLRSLDRVRPMDVDEVLPAHEWRFRGLAERAEAISAHHERRLAELLSAIERTPGSTPWELAGQLTWSRPWDAYSGRMRIHAVTETAAHVHLLERRGLVSATGGPVPGYRRTPGRSSTFPGEGGRGTPPRAAP
jgi:glyoxylase-like metal-dependent hydrolase (beta-lactamase superfamily II)